MKIEPVFNPLDKEKLGGSVADALVSREQSPLPPAERFIGAGVYALYYAGDFLPYRPIVEGNRARPQREIPIYVGKSVPRGARKGGFGLNQSPGTVLFDRLAEHAESIHAAKNLNNSDFFCRYLAVDDIWIPLGESLLIETFRPLWNLVVEGFGNHDPGKGRQQGKKSMWDVLHPGRAWADNLTAGKDQTAILSNVERFFSEQPK
ncbi:MAG: Eco29kI family restriction endonuclease [Bryobacterales bacterium]|nr:Eco29kI family restriction endonuclease [Bryobacterales bacterium]